MENEKFDTDNDIIAFVKSMFVWNRIASSLILFFSLNEPNGKGEFDPPKVFKYAENNVDDMVVKLFDLSLTSKISAVYPSREWCGKYGGFDMVIVPSMDGQTNITAKLIDFFKVLVDPYALDYLKEPFSRDYWTKRRWPEVSFNGVPIAIAQPELNFWERLEAEY